MNDKQMHELLEKFINDHKLATDINVEVNELSKRFTPKEGTEGANYEDCNLLASILLGAEHFLWWARRKNYSILPPKGCSKKKYVR